jgi:hypothetical protein
LSTQLLIIELRDYVLYFRKTKLDYRKTKFNAAVTQVCMVTAILDSLNITRKSIKVILGFACNDTEPVKVMSNRPLQTTVEN